MVELHFEKHKVQNGLRSGIVVSIGANRHCRKVELQPKQLRDLVKDDSGYSSLEYWLNGNESRFIFTRSEEFSATQ